MHGNLLKHKQSQKKNGWVKFISLQNPHNLLSREDEREVFPLLIDQGVSLTPYKCLLGGRLARKDDEVTSRSIAQRTSSKRTYTDNGDDEIIRRIEELASK